MITTRKIAALVTAAAAVVAMTAARRGANRVEGTLTLFAQGAS